MTGVWPWIPLAIAAVFGAAELAARWWIRFRRLYYVFPPGLRQRLHVDADVFPELERVVRFEVNADGERGHDVPRVAAGQRLYRVLVAGGSQPEGYLLDQDTFWPGALEGALDAPQNRRTLGASRVHVGSVARSGVNAEALDLVLARVLPRYPRLDAIVILVGASDMLRWLEDGAPDDACAPLAAADIFRCHPEESFGWKPATLALTELLRRGRRRLLKPVLVQHHAGSWIKRARAMRAQAKVIRATTHDPAPMLDRFERCLRLAIARAKAHADRVVVARQSWFDKDELTAEELAHMWHGGAGRAWCENVSTYYSIEVTSRLMGLLDDRAARVADEQGVDHIDLRAIVESTLRNYYDFFHLTPAGARLVASAVADTLLCDPAMRPTFGAGHLRCVDLRAS